MIVNRRQRSGKALIAQRRDDTNVVATTEIRSQQLHQQHLGQLVYGQLAAGSGRHVLSAKVFERSHQPGPLLELILLHKDVAWQGTQQHIIFYRVKLAIAA